MTSATRSVAVVATRLPTIDRRALSQAWFSALHVTAPSAGGTPAKRALQASANFPAAPGRAAALEPPAAHVAGSVVRPGPGRHGALRGPTPVERRMPAGELARRIERAIVRHEAVRPMGVAAIAVKAADGRVHLLVRTEAGSTRIIALCAPHLRERVDRALASARFALAASGTALEVTQ